MRAHYMKRLIKGKIPINRFHKMLIVVFGLIVTEIFLGVCIPGLRIFIITLLVFQSLLFIILPIIKNWKRRQIQNKVLNCKGDFVKLAKGYVRYKITGNESDPTLILINGFPMPYEIWENNKDSLAKVNYQVLQFDLWGFGFSDWPKDKVNTDIYCVQIRQLIKELNLSEPINIMAFSIGCTIATELVNTSNDIRFEKFVFIGPMVKPINISPFNWPIIGEYLTSLFIQKAMENIFKGNFSQNKELTLFRRVFFEQLQFKDFNRAWLSFYRNVFTKTAFHSYKKFACFGYPVLIISGKEDRIVPLQDSLLLHEELEWPLSLINDGGHSVQYECYKQVNSIVNKFLVE